MNKFHAVSIGIAVIVLAVASVFAWRNMHRSEQPNGIPAHFVCTGGKSIDAIFLNEPPIPSTAPDMPPTPQGSVRLVLSDGRTMTLPQTLSASGARYANTGESIIFWNKGNTAFMEENGTTTFDGCATAQ